MFSCGWRSFLKAELFENADVTHVTYFSNIHNVITAALFYSVLSTLLVLLELNIALYHLSRIVSKGFVSSLLHFINWTEKKSTLGKIRLFKLLHSMLYSRLLYLIKVTALRRHSMKSNLILSSALVFFFRPFFDIMLRLLMSLSTDRRKNKRGLLVCMLKGAFKRLSSESSLQCGCESFYPFYRADGDLLMRIN